MEEPKRFYARGWFGVPVVIFAGLLGWFLFHMGWGDAVQAFTLCFVTYSFAALRWRRLWPWMHRNLRAGLERGWKNEEPAKKRA